MRINDNGIDREMTSQEIAAYQKNAGQIMAELTANQDATEAVIAAKESARAKLAKLGLTEQEIAALIGG